VSSLREGHANLLCIVPILTDVTEVTSHWPDLFVYIHGIYITVASMGRAVSPTIWQQIFIARSPSLAQQTIFSSTWVVAAPLNLSRELLSKITWTGTNVNVKATGQPRVLLLCATAISRCSARILATLQRGLACCVASLHREFLTPYCPSQTCWYRMQALPSAALGVGPAARVLDVTNNHLTYLPDQLSGFTNLSRLILASNQLNALPPCLSQLTSLKVDFDIVSA